MRGTPRDLERKRVYEVLRLQRGVEKGSSEGRDLSDCSPGQGEIFVTWRKNRLTAYSRKVDREQ